MAKLITILFFILITIQVGMCVYVYKELLNAGQQAERLSISLFCEKRCK